MKRNDFMKLCAAGACGCCAPGFLAPLSAQSQSGQAQPSTPPTESEMLKRQLDFARERFADLMSIMAECVDAATRDKILRKLGHACAQEQAQFFERFRGDLQGFQAAIKKRWVDRTEYDETTGILRVVGRIPRCVCPLVKTGRTPADFCTCTTGWNQFAFSTVLGKPVTVELEESVLRGSTRCVHRIIGIKG